jgi:hypothetical protein
VNVGLASRIGPGKLDLDTGQVLPVEKCRQTSTTSSSSLGANDEYFRKNHERDLRHQG